MTVIFKEDRNIECYNEDGRKIGTITSNNNEYANFEFHKGVDSTIDTEYRYIDTENMEEIIQDLKEIKKKMEMIDK